MTMEIIKTEPSAPGKTSEKRKSRADMVTRLAESLTFSAFVIIFVVYTFWLGDVFQNADVRLLDVHSNTPILLLALSVMVTLIAGQFDLSVGSMATLSAFLTVGFTVRQEWPFWLVVVAVIAVGVGGGAINGFLVVQLRVNAFIATLATGGVFLGLSAVYSDGQVVAPTDVQLPTWFSDMGSFSHKLPSWLPWLVIAVVLAWGASIAVRRRAAYSTRKRLGAAVVVAVAAGVFFLIEGPQWLDSTSWLIAVLLLVAAVLWVLLNQTPYGRNVKATGSNPEAARLAGVRTHRVTMIAFMIGGGLSALSGITLASLNGSAAPGVAVPFLLPAFAATFLSTVLFSQGRFTVWGTITGGVFLVWVAQGLVLGGLAYTWTDVVNGLVLVSAVALSTTFRTRD
jgi:ribose/xylose/arabinose/galactoside ABC-type transport system permease subunit